MEPTNSNNTPEQELSTLDNSSNTPIDTPKAEVEVERSEEQVKSDKEHDDLVASYQETMSSQVGDDAPVDSDSKNKKQPDFFDNYIEMAVDRIYSTRFDSAEKYWDQDEKRQEDYKAKYGDKAKEVFDEEYEAASQKHWELAKAESEKVELDSMYIDIYGTDSNKAARNTASVVLETKSGARREGDRWTNQIRSVRQADAQSDTVTFADGTFRKLEEGETFESLVNSDEVTKDGKKIVGYEYDPSDKYDRTPGHVKAILEGEIPTGEVVNYWDMHDNILSSNNLESHWLTDFGRTIPRATIGLAADLLTTVAELTNGVGVIIDKRLLGGDGDNDVTRETRDLITRINSFKMSKTDYDQEHMMTAANTFDLVATILGQYFLGGAIAGAAGTLMGASTKAIKAGTVVGKQLERANKVKRAVQWGSMSLMAGTGMKDEGRKAGFSEEALAWMYMAYIPAMGLAQRMSSLTEGTVTRLAQKAHFKQGLLARMVATAPKAAVKELEKTKGIGEASMKPLAALWTWAKDSADKTMTAVHANVIKDGASAYAAASAMEASEEVFEQLFEDGLKQAVSAISYFTNEDPTKAPMFKTVFDEGYFAGLIPDYAMSALGGAIGGSMYKGIGQLNGDSLAGESNIVKGSDADMAQQFAYMDPTDPRRVAFLKYTEAQHKKDNGVFGSTVYSSKPSVGRGIKMTELSPEDAKNYPSIADTNYLAFMAQFNQYSSVLSGGVGRLSDFKKLFPDEAALLGDEMTDFRYAKTAYEERAQLYKDLKISGGDVDPEIKEAIVKDAESKAEEESVGESIEEPAKKKGKKGDKKADDTEKKEEDTDKAAGLEKEVEVTEKKPDPKTPAELKRDKVDPALVAIIKSKYKLSEEDAIRVVKSERKINDILQGKTAERELISRMSKLPQFAILTGGSTNPAINKYGESFLDRLIEADETLHVNNIERHEEEKRQRIANTEIIDNITDISDIQKLLDANPGERIRVSKESKDKLTELFAKSYDTAFTNNGGKILTLQQDMLEKIGLVRDITENPLSEDLVDQIQAAKDENGELSKDYKTKFLLENQEAIMHSGYYDYIMGYDTASDLAKIRRSTEIRSLTISNILQNFDNIGIDPFEVIIYNALSDALGESSGRGDIEMLADGNEQIEALKEFRKPYAHAMAKASEHLSTEAGINDVHHLGNTISTGDPSKIITDDKSILEAVTDLRNRNVQNIGDIKVFKGLADAKRLKEQIQIRKANLELLRRMHSYVAKLREYNVATLSGKEFGSDVTDAEYDKYSKYFVQNIYDPALYQRLKAKSESDKNSLTAAEQKQLDTIEVKINNLFSRSDGIIAKLDAVSGEGGVRNFDPLLKVMTTLPDQLALAERTIDDLIAVGEATADEGKMAEIYKSNAADRAIEEIRSFIGETTADGKVKLGIIKLLDNDLSKGVLDNKTLRDSDEYREFVTAALTLGAHVKMNKTDDGEIMDAYAALNELHKLMYKLPEGIKSRFLSYQVMNPENFDAYTPALINAFVDVEEFNKDFKGIMKQQMDFSEAHGEAAPILPISDQIIVAKIAYGFLTDTGEYGKGRLSDRFASTEAGKTSLNKGAIDFSNMLFIEGGLGTGKTKIALGYALAASRNALTRKHPDFKAQVLLASNNARQIETMYETVAKEFSNVEDEVVFQQRGFNQKELYTMLSSKGDTLSNSELDLLNKKLEDVAYIAYDEATFIEYNIDNMEINALGTMMNAIHLLNKLRRIPAGLPPLRMLTLGDGQQGGYHSNMPRITDEDVDINYDNMGERADLTTNEHGNMVTPKLTIQFRSYVNEIPNTVAYALAAAGNKAVSAVLGDSTGVASISTSHGIIQNDPDKKRGGVDIINSSLGDGEDSIYNDEKLIADIKQQIENAKADTTREPFKVILVTEEQDLPDSPLAKFIAENKGENITVESIQEVQGNEADYVLLDLPYGFLPALSDINEDSKPKYELFAMLMGRARYYVKANVGTNVNFQKSTKDIIMVEKEVKDTLKRDWKHFLYDGIFSDTEASNVVPLKPTIDPDPIDPEINKPKPAIKVIDPKANVSSEMTKFLNENTTASDMLLNLNEIITNANFGEDELIPDDIEDWTRADLESAQDEIENMHDPKESADEKARIDLAVESIDMVLDIVDGDFDQSTESDLDESTSVLNILTKSAKEAKLQGKWLYNLNSDKNPKIAEKANRGFGYVHENSPDPAKQRKNQLYYLQDIFNSSFETSDIPTVNIDSVDAGGGGVKGDSVFENSNVEYVIVAHEYNDGGTALLTNMQIGFRLMAKYPNGKYVLLANIPGIHKFDKDGPIYKMLYPLHEKLTNAATQYDDDNVPFDTVKEGFEESENNAGFTIHEQAIRNIKFYKNNKDEDLSLKKKLGLGRYGSGKTALYISIPIHRKAMKAIVVGHTPGSLRTSTDKTLAAASGNEMTKGIRFVDNIKNNSDSIIAKIASDTGGNKSVTLDMMDNNPSFVPFSDGSAYKVITVPGNATKQLLFMVKVGKRTVPFLTDNVDVVPVFGFDSKGNPIKWEGEDSVKLDPTIEAVRTFLKKGYKFKPKFSDIKSTTIVEDTANIIRESIADKLKYTVEDLDTSTTSKFNVASKHIIEQAPQSWDAHKLTLKEFNELLTLTGRRTDMLNFSKPKVFKNVNSEKFRGKAFIFYSQNGKHDLDDYDQMIKLVTSNVVSKNAAITDEDITNAIDSDLRDGVGIIMLDVAPTGLVDLFRIAKKADKTALSKMNRFIIPSGGASGVRFMSLLVEIAEILQRGSGFGIAQRANINLEYFNGLENLKNALEESRVRSNDGKPVKSILDQDRKAELSRMLEGLYLTKDPKQIAVANHFINMIMTSVMESNLGKIKYELDDEKGNRVESSIPGRVIPGGKIVRNAKGRIFIDSHPAAPIKFVSAKALNDSDLSRSDDNNEQILNFNLAGFLANVAAGSLDPGLNTLNDVNTVSTETAEGALNMLQEIMTTFTNENTLRNGLSITPAIAGRSAEESLFADLEDDGTLENRLLTNIKDIFAPSMLYDIKALSAAIDQSVADAIKRRTTEPTKPSTTIIAMQVSKLSEASAAIIEAISSIAININTTPTDYFHSSLDAQLKAMDDLKPDGSVVEVMTKFKELRKGVVDAINKLKIIKPMVADFSSMKGLENKIPSAEALHITEDAYKVLLDNLRHVHNAITKADVDAIAGRLDALFPNNSDVSTYVSGPIRAIPVESIVTVERIQHLIDNTREISGITTSEEVAAFQDSFDNLTASPDSKAAALYLLQNDDTLTDNETDKKLLESFLMTGINDVTDTLYTNAVEMKDTLINSPERLDMKDFSEMKRKHPDIYEKIMKSREVKENLSIIAARELSYNTDLAKQAEVEVVMNNLEIDDESRNILMNEINTRYELLTKLSKEQEIQSIFIAYSKMIEANEGRDLNGIETMINSDLSVLSTEQKQILQNMIDEKIDPHDMHPIQILLTGIENLNMSNKDIAKLEEFYDKLLAAGEHSEGMIEALITYISTDDHPKQAFFTRLGMIDRSIGGLLDTVKDAIEDANAKTC